MIFFGGGRPRGCGVIGCLPVLLGAILISIMILILTGGHVFFFAI